MTSMGTSRDLTGGASLPGSIGFVSASYPFAVLHADSEGIEVFVRPPWLARFFGASRWSRRYSEIQRVYANQRSVVMLVTPGNGCRFTCMRRRQAQQLQQTLRAGGLNVVPVNSVAWKLLEM